LERNLPDSHASGIGARNAAAIELSIFRRRSNRCRFVAAQSDIDHLRRLIGVRSAR
jgi:hypothetical protein